MPPPRRPAAAAAAFYARTLPFIATIVAQWFAIFAVLAYVVPHVLCRDELGQSRVRVLAWGGGREGGCLLAEVGGRVEPQRPLLPLPLSQSPFDQEGRSSFYQCIYNMDTNYRVHTGRKVRRMRDK